MIKDTVKLPINRIVGKAIESDLVYPIDKGCNMIAKLDSNWVRSRLKIKLNVEYINNKYAVVIEPYRYGEKQIWYQHDKDTWLIELNH